MSVFRAIETTKNINYFHNPAAIPSNVDILQFHQCVKQLRISFNQRAHRIRWFIHIFHQPNDVKRTSVWEIILFPKFIWQLLLIDPFRKANDFHPRPERLENLNRVCIRQ